MNFQSSRESEQALSALFSNNQSNRFNVFTRASQGGPHAFHPQDMYVALPKTVVGTVPADTTAAVSVALPPNVC